MRAAPLLVGLLLAACSTPYTGTDKDACEALAQADCKKLDQCEHDGVVNGYGDEATCEQLMLAQCKARFEAGHTGQHASEIESCIAALPSASCGDYEEDTLDACEPQPGTAATGKACAFSTQCGSGFCAVATNDVCGTCAAFSNANDDCSAHACSPGFACVAATKMCEPPSAPGDPCDADEPCGFALTCVTAAGATFGTCVASEQTVGAPCDPQHETAPDCDAASGVTCAVSTKTCVALTYATAGQPCGNVSGTTVACAMKSSCVGGSATTAGTCVAFAAAGAGCDTAAGPSCAPPAVCVTGSATVTAGTCKLPDASACD